MTSSTSPNVENQESTKSVPRPISPTLRSRLQKCHGFGQQKQKEGAFDAAHAMFGQCVAADPANLVYVESMLNNLFTRYRSAKRNKLKVRSNRAPFKKALAEKDWIAVLKQGPEFLEENPWDVVTLRGLAQACAGLRHTDERFNDIELRYLRTALDGDPKNVEVNKHCAESLARMGQFDQAIACWHRIEELSSAKAEAQKHISDLTVLKNMRANGLLDEAHSSATQTANPTAPRPNATTASTAPEKSTKAEQSHSKPASDVAGPSPHGTVPSIEALEQAITKSPENLQNYLTLAKLHERGENWLEVERILRRALSVSGNDIHVVEKLENAQIRRGRLNVAKAEARLKSQPNEENQQLVHRLKADLNRLELGIYNSRVQRYPNQVNYKFELAVCLKRAGNLKTAAEYFAEAATDPKLEAAARVQRGECLQQIRHYQEAMREYLAGAESASHAKAGGIQRLGLYRAGVLAMGLKGHHQARKIFERLATVDPSFQDVQSRLDKLRRLGDN